MTILTLQSQVELTGDVGLFRDTQSLLFLAALHDLLPRLRADGDTSEVDLLLQAMLWHARIVWLQEPAHSLHLQARVLEDMGDASTGIDLLYNAFRLTPPSEHDYVTRAQAFWSALLDAGRHDEARRFALTLYRQAPEACLVEIEDMVRESVSAGLAQVRDPGRRSRRT